MKVNQTVVRLARGATVRLIGKSYGVFGTGCVASWTSSHPSVATVSAAGKIKALKAGSATLTYRFGAKVAKVRVKVVSRKVAQAKHTVRTISASGIKAKLNVGQVRYVTGKYSPVTAVGVKVRYASSKHAVATIDAAGRLVGRKAGTVKITVKAGGKKKVYKVRVTK